MYYRKVGTFVFWDSKFVFELFECLNSMQIINESVRCSSDGTAHTRITGRVQLVRRVQFEQRPSSRQLAGK